jgi:hypothetical protein
VRDIKSVDLPSIPLSARARVGMIETYGNQIIMSPFQTQHLVLQRLVVLFEIAILGVVAILDIARDRQ